ncbi:MAG TPA: hypothetical protein VJH20_04240 [Candidatus Nanoarchaeia archaeon]|nr:hypothetical protein [Candidatus Nanoarchaeia archaeon]
MEKDKLISDLAGSWKISESEWKEIKVKTKKEWSEWKNSVDLNK